MKRIVIVGGGITGLAAARALERAETPCEVRLVEASMHLGGGVQTIRHNAFTIDSGAESWRSSDVATTRLVRELGLGDEIIEARADAERRYVASERRLHPVPEDLFVDLATPLTRLLESELFGWDAKLRALLERVVPRRASDDEESIAAFVTRRLGVEVAERLADPVYGALFAGDIASLSVHACAPHLVAAEHEHRSLLAAAAVAQRERSRVSLGGPTSAHLSLKRGIGDLVINLAHRLRDAEVLVSRPALRLGRLAEGDPRGRWVVDTSAGPLHADDVILALPANAVSVLVDDLDSELARLCRELEYTSTVSVALAYRKFDVRHPLDASGILVPRAEGRPVRECAFVSSRWDHRAPAGQLLLRVVLGGVAHEDVVSAPDDWLADVARTQVCELLTIERPALFAKVFRIERAILQPNVGYRSRMSRILARVAGHPGLHLGGDRAREAGIEGAVRAGEALASAVDVMRS